MVFVFAALCAFEASDSKRPVAILPESCRPKEVLHFAPGTATSPVGYAVGCFKAMEQMVEFFEKWEKG